jgi:hypothetical protein
MRTISSTVNSKTGCVSWGTTATLRARSRAGIDARSAPKSAMLPADGRSAAEARRTSVVFPLPFGPRIPVIVPVTTERSSAAKIGTRR